MNFRTKMRPPPSRPSSIFFSLKQVEKRLKLEDPSQSHTRPLPETEDFSAESLGSPICLHFGQSSSHPSTLQDDSEPPQAFLSSSQQIQPQSTDPDHQKSIVRTEEDAVDDIQRLVQLLGLSDCDEEDQEGEKERAGLGDSDCCDCEGGFYAKIVGVKGPKCRKEEERLNGWIQYFMNGCGVEEKKEPLRLAYLLLGKAAFVSQGDDSGNGGLEFPSSIQEFLQNDPPKA